MNNKAAFNRNLFAAGRVRALESELLDSTAYRRFLENRTEQDFLDALSETGYADYTQQRGFEEGLKYYLNDVYIFLKTNAEEPAALDIFYLKNDICNFIAALKNSLNENSFQSGVYNFKDWESKKFPQIFDQAKTAVIKQKETEDTAEVHDSLIEKICMDIITQQYAAGLKSRAVRNYWMNLIDVSNALKNANHPSADYYFKGGNIEDSYWKSIDLKQDIPDRVENFAFMKSVEGETDVKKWEPAMKKWLSRKLKDMRKITFGVEPLVSYMLSVMEEINNLKLIRTGIRTGMAADEIREFINLSYV